MSRLVILFLTLSLLCGSSEADLSEFWAEAEQSLHTFRSFAAIPIKLFNSFLGTSSDKKDPTNISGKRVTAEVGDGSDLITIIKSPQSPLGVSHVRRPYPPYAGEDSLVFFQNQRPQARVGFAPDNRDKLPSGVKQAQIPGGMSPERNNNGLQVGVPDGLQGNPNGGLNGANNEQRTGGSVGELANALDGGLANGFTGGLANGLPAPQVGWPMG
ncbi:uncharacterized protein LOC135426654 [Drosophila montana]|uniref:uncharacterized protein LOC135426654 n=1 Tax=Drosophila montana TaxID=40370 RepID=UPI00313B8B79